ncbi:LysR family transcriptional regulator [Clostridium sp. OS1-26]|uniref:LysR family transcriptional regulator n=1 Tax=Clostridium sp. OS1-26 TaxID=3070681 RepID=UPI0027DFCAAF|nr:LysR family transcriptional regulator [Clostridium sp. OS1-26]WML34674.1 LysR family transcriptional regulator [Clostridium sp. OS1-26]
MNLHGLRLFYVVAKTGSVTLAAEQLRISQPAITSQIKKFERELGISLFSPEGRGVRLTEIGEKLADQARILFTLEDRMEILISDYIQGKKGTLKIAGNYLASNFLIPKWASYLKQQNEDINIEVTTMNTEDAVQRLISYQVDVAVVGSGAINHIDEININKIAEDELWFIVAPSHKYANQKVTLANMMLEPFIMREKGSYTRICLESICRTYGSRLPNVSLEFNGLHEVLMAVVEGYGANFCSSMVVKELVDMGKLSRVYVDDITLKNEIVICTRKNEKISPIVNKFICSMKI